MKRVLRITVKLIVVSVVAIFGMRIAFPLPDISNRAPSLSVAASDATTLGRFMRVEQAKHPEGLTGVLPLQSNEDAFTSRLALIDAAEATLDLQYYIWHDDMSGMILLDALKRAARRGVSVRLLLDDNGIPGLDVLFATLNDQENFDIRLYNPSTLRRPKLLGYSFDFFRMNRRMHNKAIIADSAAAIIGGRNIGDEYLRSGIDSFYFDLDVLAFGPAVEETRHVFDLYWNSASSFEAETIFSARPDPAHYEARVATLLASADAQEISARAKRLGLVDEGASAALEWTKVQLVADSPLKGQGIATDDDLMIYQLGAILGGIDTHLSLASAYFVPGEAGTAFFTDLAARGVQVEILTNALDTTDVFLVHAGYSRYRRALLEGGVDLYELKLRGAPAKEEAFQLLPFGLSGASLHAKTFSVDHKRIFIGSFNFDPRSAKLNTEMGFLIDSPSMAARMSTYFENTVSNFSYQPKLTPEGHMVWHDKPREGALVTYQQEPGASWLQQVSFAVIGFLPVEWLL